MPFIRRLIRNLRAVGVYRFLHRVHHQAPYQVRQKINLRSDPHVLSRISAGKRHKGPLFNAISFLPSFQVDATRLTQVLGASKTSTLFSTQISGVLDRSRHGISPISALHYLSILHEDPQANLRKTRSATCRRYLDR